MRRRIVILLTAVLFSLLIASCSEGIFNFSDDTGNISFSFSKGITLGEDLGAVVFNFTNNESGDSIRRDMDISGDSVDFYLSRVDAGSWNVSTTVYLADGTLAAERSDSFDLELGETVIAELSYWSNSSGSGIDIVWEQTTGSLIQPMITISKLDTLISSFHTMGLDTVMKTALVCTGTGFTDYMNSIRLTLPDSTSFEYSGGWAKTVSDFSIETSAAYLSINVGDYSSRGDYSLTLTDLNDVDVEVADNCWFDFNPDSGAATINSWGQVETLFSTEYEKNDSAQAGTYLFYLVDRTDGTQVNVVAAIPTAPVVYTDPSVAGDLALPATVAFPAIGDQYLMLITLDADLTQTDITNAFIPNTTNLSPTNIAAWLYTNFGDSINFIGISLAEY